MSSHPHVILEIAPPEAEEAESSLRFEIRRLPYSRSAAIMETLFQGFEEAGVVRSITDALGAMSLGFNADDIKAQLGDSYGLNAATLKAMATSNVGALVDVMREIMSTHLMTGLRSIPRLAVVACDAAVSILDNETNYRLHKKTLKLAAPEKRNRIYVGSEDLRDSIASGVTFDDAMTVITSWFEVEHVKEPLGKLLGLVRKSISPKGLTGLDQKGAAEPTTSQN